MTFEEIKDIVSGKCPGAVVGEDPRAVPRALVVRKESIRRVCECLHSHEKLYFDMLSCLSGIDNGADKGLIEVVYNLYSIPYGLHLMLKAGLDRDRPEIDSVAGVWRTAGWHEREAFDLLGIRFNGHPDLRRILLPSDWEGFPLRKDYREQEKYHGMNVAYDRGEQAENWKSDTPK